MAHSQKNKYGIEYLVRVLLLIMLVAPLFAHSQEVEQDLSRWNKKRPVRSKTLYIVLHTTEAGNSSSLNSVKKSGTCNYLVETDGTIHEIISDKKVAKHAGRSMWCGHTNLSNISIGIEVVGYHNKPLTTAQYMELKKLLRKLRAKYGLSDTRIVTHSMVAVGKPNRYHRYFHKGRKRCGMLMATAEVRTKLGLSNTFVCDPDVQAHRVKSADPYLARILYCGKKITKNCTGPVNPDPVKGVTHVEENEEDESFEGFDTVMSGETPYSIAGKEYRSSTTIYFFDDGKIREGHKLTKKQLDNIPVGTRMVTGYVFAGRISKNRSAFSITKEKWNDPSTFYVDPVTHAIKTGDDVDEDNLPNGAIVLFRK